MSNFGSIFKGALKGFVMSGGSPLGAGAGAVSERKKERAILKAEIAQQDYLRRQQEILVVLVKCLILLILLHF